MSTGAPRRHPLRRIVARLFWATSRFRLVREEPVHHGPRVVIGAPHTSNWDFLLMLGIAWDAGVNLRWLGKKELFRGPAGPVMRALGGIAVDRKDASRVVGEVVALMAREPDALLVVTPDGTRSNSGFWRSGFYRIARDAGLPLGLGYVDRTTRTTGIGPTFELTGDVGADMDRIRAFYADKSGVRPEKRAEPRLRDESSAG